LAAETPLNAFMQARRWARRSFYSTFLRLGPAWSGSVGRPTEECQRTPL